MDWQSLPENCIITIIIYPFSTLQTMQTRIFLVRHGQTEWNAQNRLQGHKNSPLTHEGKQQALMIRQALRKTLLYRAYVSPLQRALQTLNIIVNGRNVEVIQAEGLKEICLGVWEGQTKEQTKKTHPEQYADFWYRQERFALQGAETFQQLQVRVVRELDAVFSRNRGRNVLVVSHWIAIKVALAHYLSVSLNRLSSLTDPGNGSYMEISQTKDGSVTFTPGGV
jgi:probable phosphoglycerate mutase